MVYKGSKARIAKYIIPILNNIIKINNCDTFIDFCCGGANIVANPHFHIQCNNKFGYDKNKYLIALINKVKNENLEYIPITEEEYYKIKYSYENGEYEDWFVAYVGLFFSYGGAFFETFAKTIPENDRGRIRNFGIERYKNILKQKEQFQNVIFEEKDIFEIDVNNYNNKTLIYIDPPYYKTRKFRGFSFNHNKFWEKVRELSRNSIVVVSEYIAPDDFISIFDLKLISSINIAKSRKEVMEKLFVHKDYWWKMEKYNKNFSQLSLI